MHRLKLGLNIDSHDIDIDSITSIKFVKIDVPIHHVQIYTTVPAKQNNSESIGILLYIKKTLFH